MPTRENAARPGSRGRMASVAVAALALIVLAGCAGDVDDQSTGTTSSTAETVPPELAVGPNVSVPATLPVPDDFLAPDTRGVRLAPVLSKPKKAIDHTRPILAIEGGTATLRGRVVSPDGPVDGATVRLERFVGEDFGVLDVAAKKDGTWEAKDLRGGRYRVRAWQKPSFTTTEPQPFFLAADHGEGNVDITIERHEGQSLQGVLDVAEPHVGEQVTFRALLFEETVDDAGIVRGVGIPAAEVQLELLGGVRIVGPATVSTDADGFGLFTVVCTATGVNAVKVTSEGITRTVELPACLEAIAEPTDTTPVAVDFPVGSKFTVPFEGILPPGTYKASSGICATSLEAFFTDTWARTVVTGPTLGTANLIRGLEPVPGSTACSYERTA